MSEEAKKIIAELKNLSNPKNVEGMSRFGINPNNTLGISIPVLRAKAKEIGKNHHLAQELWGSGIHEVRILAALIDDHKEVTEKQMEEWVKDFDSWDVCDQVCMNLFDKTSFAYSKAIEWSKRGEEFVRRAGFALMASLASHDKKAADQKFEQFFPMIRDASTDERNFVKKAVSWALRQIGKRNEVLRKGAIEVANEIQKLDNKHNFLSGKSSRWVASNVLKELTNR